MNISGNGFRKKLNKDCHVAVAPRNGWDYSIIAISS